MNLDQLRAGLQKNKKGLAVAGAAAVAGLALMNRGKGDGPDVTTTGEEAAAGAGAAYGLTRATGGYDSSSSDVYNALQPQLEELGRNQSRIEELLQEREQDSQPAPTPVVAPPSTRPPAPKPTARKPAPRPPAKKSAPRKPAPRVYTVKKGDSLSQIGQRLGVDWRKLHAGNRQTIGGNPNLIRPGQQLRY